MLARLLLHGLSFVTAPTVELTWSAGPECPSAQAAEQAIVERLWARGFQGHVRVQAVVRESEPGAEPGEPEWIASVTVGDAVRFVELQSCADAARSVAVVVAIATVVEPPSPAPIPPAPVGPSIPVPDERPPESVAEDRTPASVVEEPRPLQTGAVPESPPPPRSDATPVGVALGAEGLLAYGALPGVGAGLVGDVGLQWRRAFVQAGALHRFQREHGVSADTPLGGAFRLTAGRIAAGPRYRIRMLELAAAGGAELGAIWARGVGVSTPLPRRRLWAAVSLGGRIGVRVADWLAVAATVEGAVPVLRPSFSLGGRVQVAQVGPALMRAGLRIEFRPRTFRIPDTRGQ